MSIGVPNASLLVPTIKMFSANVAPLYSEPSLTVTGVPLFIVVGHSKFCQVVPIPKSPKPVVMVEYVLGLPSTAFISFVIVPVIIELQFWVVA